MNWSPRFGVVPELCRAPDSCGSMRSSAADSHRTARANFRSCAIPGAAAPYDRASLKIFYPAIADDSAEQRNAGIMPVDEQGGPFPILIMMPGINVGPESYAWLAGELAICGVVVVTYSMIAEEAVGPIDDQLPPLDVLRGTLFISFCCVLILKTSLKLFISSLTFRSITFA